MKKLFTNKSKQQIQKLLDGNLSLNELHNELLRRGVALGLQLLTHLQRTDSLSAETILHAYKTTNQTVSGQVPKRQIRSANKKYANRRNPLEVEQKPERIEDWRQKYDDPTVVISNPSSWRDTKLCDMMSEDARIDYQRNGNMLYVIQAFYQRVDMLSGCLTEANIVNAQSENTPYPLYDGGGLYLLIEPDGGKIWHLEFSIAGDTRVFPFASYPECSLSRARRYHLACRHLTKDGKDPSAIIHRNELDSLVDCIYDKEPDVPVPVWMAQTLADCFKQYYSRKFLHGENISLDSAFGIGGERRRSEFDTYSVETTKLLEKAREIQWYCRLSFATAAKNAIRLLELESPPEELDESGVRLFSYSIPALQSLCENEAKGCYGNYAAWCDNRKFSIFASSICRDSYLEYVETLDPKLRKSLERDMRNRKKALKLT